MRVLFIMLFTICSFSCKKDEFEQSFGKKLLSVEYQEVYSSQNEYYFYSPLDQLTGILNFESTGRSYEIKYENGLIKEFNTYRNKDNQLIFRDSFIYNTNNTILAIHNFSINAGENVQLAYIHEFEYDDQNKVSKKTTTSKTFEYSTITKYYWKGDNIVRELSYNSDEILCYEYCYEYDKRNNYQKKLAKGLSDPINWSKNNITKVTCNDYTGLLDLFCNPCITEYKYNLDNYPVSIIFNWGKEMKLNYE